MACVVNDMAKSFQQTPSMLPDTHPFVGKFKSKYRMMYGLDYVTMTAGKREMQSLLASSWNEFIDTATMDPAVLIAQAAALDSEAPRTHLDSCEDENGSFDRFDCDNMQARLQAPRSHSVKLSARIPYRYDIGLLDEPNLDQERHGKHQPEVAPKSTGGFLFVNENSLRSRYQGSEFQLFASSDPIHAVYLENPVMKWDPPEALWLVDFIEWIYGSHAGVYRELEVYDPHSDRKGRVDYLCVKSGRRSIPRPEARDARMPSTERFENYVELARPIMYRSSAWKPSDASCVLLHEVASKSSSELRSVEDAQSWLRVWVDPIKPGSEARSATAPYTGHLTGSCVPVQSQKQILASYFDVSFPNGQLSCMDRSEDLDPTLVITSKLARGRPLEFYDSIAFRIAPSQSLLCSVLLQLDQTLWAIKNPLGFRLDITDFIKAQEWTLVKAAKVLDGRSVELLFHACVMKSGNSHTAGGDPRFRQCIRKRCRDDGYGYNSWHMQKRFQLGGVRDDPARSFSLDYEKPNMDKFLCEPIQAICKETAQRSELGKELPRESNEVLMNRISSMLVRSKRRGNADPMPWNTDVEVPLAILSPAPSAKSVQLPFDALPSRLVDILVPKQIVVDACLLKLCKTMIFQHSVVLLPPIMNLISIVSLICETLRQPPDQASTHVSLTKRSDAKGQGIPRVPLIHIFLFFGSAFKIPPIVEPLSIKWESCAVSISNTFPTESYDIVCADLGSRSKLSLAVSSHRIGAIVVDLCMDVYDQWTESTSFENVHRLLEWLEKEPHLLANSSTLILATNHRSIDQAISGWRRSRSRTHENQGFRWQTLDQSHPGNNLKPLTELCTNPFYFFDWNAELLEALLETSASQAALALSLQSGSNKPKTLKSLEPSLLKSALDQLTKHLKTNEQHVRSRQNPRADLVNILYLHVLRVILGKIHQDGPFTALAFANAAKLQYQNKLDLNPVISGLSEVIFHQMAALFSCIKTCVHSEHEKWNSRPAAWHRRQRGILLSRGVLAAKDPSASGNTFRVLILTRDTFTLAALRNHFGEHEWTHNVTFQCFKDVTATDLWRYCMIGQVHFHSIMPLPLELEAALDMLLHANLVRRVMIASQGNHTKRLLALDWQG